MSRYKRIIIAVDLNMDTDTLLINRAKELLTAAQDEIYLVHALEPLDSYGNSYAYPMIDDAEINVSAEHRTRLVEEATKLGISSERLIINFGFPDKIVAEEAKRLNADLIIVGSHSRHGLALLFNSNIAEHITRHAPCDLLTIHLPD